MADDRRRKYRFTGIAAAAVVAALSLAGCSATNGQQAGTDTKLTLAMSEPEYIVPGLYSGGETAILQALFAPLLEMDSKGAQQLMAAESIETKDNRVWTIKLKPWKFHNGEPVTAQNYVDTINASAYGPNAWAQSSKTSNIEGFATLNPTSGTPSSKTLSGLRVVDKLIFEITLVKPDVFFPSILATAQSPFVPFPSEAFQNLKAFEEHPIGNGPYKMDGDWQHNQVIKLSAWDGWEGKPVAASAVDVKIYTGKDAAYADYRAGQVDVSYMIPDSASPTLKSEWGSKAYITPELFSQFLSFPYWAPQFNDIRVRQAISMAIDRDTIADKVFGGTVEASKGLIPGGAVGGASQNCGEFCDYNPDAARALYKEAGGLPANKLTLYWASWQNQEEAKAIANNLRNNLGIDVNIQIEDDWGAFTAKLGNHQVDGLYTGQWGASTPSPGEILRGEFLSTSPNFKFTGGEPSKEIDDAILSAPKLPDVNAAASAYNAADALILKTFRQAPLTQSGSVRLLSDRVDLATFDGVYIWSHFTFKK